MVKVLFMIDDDVDDREVFQEAIRTSYPDIDLIFAYDGVQALEILNGSNRLPDIIFLDYNMPRMSGLQCLKALKASDKFKHIPTVMYTTSGDREEENVVRMFGVDYYMRKTTSFIELCAELKTIIETTNSKSQKTSSGETS